MKIRSWLVILLSMWILPGAAIGASNADSEVVLMDDVLVSGSRMEQKNEKIPAQVTVITAEQIRKSGAQTVPDALRNLGGVMVTDIQGNGMFQTVDMGGFGTETAGSHVAIVVNGRKINPIDLSSIGFASIPVENIARIEVLYGGNSVLYGSDAMGGVINIITKEAEDGFHANAEAAGGSNDAMKSAANLSFSQGKFGFRAGVVHQETDGYRERSKSRRKNVHGKFSFYGSDAFGIHLEANATDLAYQYPGSLTKAQYEQNRKQAVNKADEGESQEQFYVLTVNSDWGKFGRMDVDLSFRDYERQDLITSWASYRDYDYNTLGANPQYVLDKDLFNMGNRLTLGIEYYDTDYDAWTGPAGSKVKTTTFEHGQKTCGMYIQDELNLTQSLVMNLGARYEDFETNLNSSFGTKKDIDNDEWAWNAGLSYVFSPGSKIFTRAYQAFRVPKVEDYISTFSGAINTDLKHETSMGYEVGIRVVALEKHLAANLRLYSFNVDDEIAWSSTQNENIGETRHRGGEFDLTYRMTDLISLFGSMGYTDPSFEYGANTGKTIPLVPEIKGNAGFTLDFDFGLSYKFQYNYLGSRYQGGDNANTQEKLGEANTIDMSLTYTYKMIQIFANATNMFNQEYATSYYGGYYPEAEAIYFGGVRISF